MNEEMNNTENLEKEHKILYIGSVQEDSITINSDGSDDDFQEARPLIGYSMSLPSRGSSSVYYDALETVSNGKGGSVSMETASAADLQASLILPSTRLSSHASLRNSSEIIKRKNLSKSKIGNSSQRSLGDYGVSSFLAIANLLPFLIGSATFSLPYAVARGGLISIPGFIIITLLADTSGILLADALYTSSKGQKKKRVYLDYVELAHAAAGRCGSRLLNFVLIFYLYANNTVSLVLIGKSMYDILHEHATLSLMAITVIFSLLVIPPLFITKLSKLAYLSTVSTLSIIVGGIASIVIFVQHRDRWIANAHALPLFDAEGLAFSLSVWLFMVICHSVIPQVEGSMRDPEAYPRVLHISYLSSTLVKICFGVMGALTFGNATNPIVTINIIVKSISIIANAALTCYAVSSFPINFYIVCESFDKFILRNRNRELMKGGKYHYYWILLTRPILVGVGLGIALVVPYFGLLAGVLGSVLAILLVFVFPCWFHLKLKWRTLATWKIILEVMVLITGVCLGLAGLYASLKGLIKALRAGHT